MGTISWYEYALGLHRVYTENIYTESIQNNSWSRQSLQRDIRIYTSVMTVVEFHTALDEIQYSFTP